MMKLFGTVALVMLSISIVIFLASEWAKGPIQYPPPPAPCPEPAVTPQVVEIEYGSLTEVLYPDGLRCIVLRNTGNVPISLDCTFDEEDSQ